MQRCLILRMYLMRRFQSCGSVPGAARPGGQQTLAQNDAVSVTLFAFAAGEEIGTHDSTGDAMVTVLEGVGQFTVDGVPYLVNPARRW